jgi:hypothetical protein
MNDIFMFEGVLHYINILFRKSSGAIHEIKIPEPNKCLIETKAINFFNLVIEAITP